MYLFIDIFIFLYPDVLLEIEFKKAKNNKIELKDRIVAETLENKTSKNMSVKYTTSCSKPLLLSVESPS